MKQILSNCERNIVQLAATVFNNCEILQDQRREHLVTVRIEVQIVCVAKLFSLLSVPGVENFSAGQK